MDIKNLDWGKGLFRIWIVGSLCWVALVFSIFFIEPTSFCKEKVCDYTNFGEIRSNIALNKILIGHFSGDKKKIGRYKKEIDNYKKKLEQMSNDGETEVCLKWKSGSEPCNNVFFVALALAFLAPLAVLIAYKVIVWALKGFKK